MSRKFSRATGSPQANLTRPPAMRVRKRWESSILHPCGAAAKGAYSITSELSLVGVSQVITAKIFRRMADARIRRTDCRSVPQHRVTNRFLPAGRLPSDRRNRASGERLAPALVRSGETCRSAGGEVRRPASSARPLQGEVRTPAPGARPRQGEVRTPAPSARSCARARRARRGDGEAHKSGRFDPW